MSCISARGLTKSYGNLQAVDGLNLSVDSGRVFGFLGPNGAGKSTTIKILTTLIRPDGGGLTILGTDAVKHPLDVRRRIGVVLQQPSYEPTLTVIRSLDKYGMMWGVPADERKKRAAQLIEDFGLAGIRDKRNEDLSIGQRRRVQVAREFMHDMDLLFLDEPTVGLDPSARRNLLDYLKRRVRTGLTIFFTTHVLTEAEYICDEIAIINGGKVIAIDTPEQLKGRFGREKTVKIRVSGGEIAHLLDGTTRYTIESDTITFRSSDLGGILSTLQTLDAGGIEVEDLSVVPTNLEEIFFRVVEDSDASDN